MTNNIAFFDLSEIVSCFCSVNEFPKWKCHAPYDYLYYLGLKQIDKAGQLKSNVDDYAVEFPKLYAYSQAGILKSAGSYHTTNLRSRKLIRTLVKSDEHKSKKYAVLLQEGVDCLVCGIRNERISEAAMDKFPLELHPVKALLS